mgnify:CR=1 FL=1
MDTKTYIEQSYKRYRQSAASDAGDVRSAFTAGVRCTISDFLKWKLLCDKTGLLPGVPVLLKCGKTISVGQYRDGIWMAGGAIVIHDSDEEAASYMWTNIPPEAE